MKKAFIKLFLITLILGGLMLGDMVLAADTSPFVLECLSHPADKSCDDVSVFIVLAISIGRYLFSFVGAVALLFFVYGGIIMITSRGNKESISNGTKAMTAAVIGLIVAFSGYALISFLGKTMEVKKEFQLTYQDIRNV